MFDNNGEVQCHCRNSKSTSSMVHGNAAVHICEEQSAACVLMLLYEIFHFAFWPNQPRRCGQYIHIYKHTLGWFGFLKNQVWKFMTCHTCIYIYIYISSFLCLYIYIYTYVQIQRDTISIYQFDTISIYQFIDLPIDLQAKLFIYVHIYAFSVHAAVHESVACSVQCIIVYL